MVGDIVGLSVGDIVGLSVGLGVGDGPSRSMSCDQTGAS